MRTLTQPLSISATPTHLFDHLPYLNMKTAFAVLALVAGASAFNGENQRTHEGLSCFACVSFVEDGSFWIVGVATDGSLLGRQEARCP